MNAFYNWNNDEIVITERMKDIQREADQVRLLRKAGLSNSSRRMAVAFRNALIRLGEHLQKKPAKSLQASQTRGNKYAM